MQRFSGWLFDQLEVAGYTIPAFSSHSGIAVERLDQFKNGYLPDVNEMALIVETLSRHTKRPPTWFYIGWHEYGWFQLSSSSKKTIMGLMAEGDPERVRDLTRLNWVQCEGLAHYDYELVDREASADGDFDSEDEQVHTGDVS